MARKKNNRASLEENKRIYRKNQALMHRAAQENEELEKTITQQEDFEIVGIIRKHKIGLDNLALLMEGIRPSGESLFSEEKQKPFSSEEEAELLTPKKAKEKQAEKPVHMTEKEDMEHEEE